MRTSLEKEYLAVLLKKHALERELADLPDGYISEKAIKGKVQHYLQRRVGKRIVGTYIRNSDVPDVAAGIERRKVAAAEIRQLNERLIQLEQAAKLIGDNMFCRLTVYKMSAGMDALSADEKAVCASFGSTMNSIEGVQVSEETGREIDEWKAGQRSFLSVFESVLKRYGFPAGVQG